MIQSYAYKSSNGFACEPLAYGLGIKPECTVPSDYRLPQDIKTMMDDQRAVQASQQAARRIHIGGEIEIHHLSKGGFHTYVLDRFEDFDRDEAAIYERFRTGC